MFYQKFKDLCTKKGVSMSYVLDESHLSRGNLSRWKDGIEPKFDTLQRIASVLEVQIDQFLDIKPLPTKGKLGTHHMQEAFAIVNFLRDMGYKIVEADNDDYCVVIWDERSDKYYRLEHDLLFSVEQNIIAYSKFQLHELLSQTPEYNYRASTTSAVIDSEIEVAKDDNQPK